jgi:hypothetical protein
MTPQNIGPPPPRGRRDSPHLTIDASVEAAHIASVTVEIGDLFAAEHSLAVAVRQLRKAIVQFAEWQGLAKGMRR